MVFDFKEVTSDLRGTHDLIELWLICHITHQFWLSFQTNNVIYNTPKYGIDKSYSNLSFHKSFNTAIFQF